MVQLRACVYLSVLFLCCHLANGKPIFEFLWCSVVCEEDDASTPTTTSSDEWDDILCGACYPSRPRTTTPNPAATTINPATAMPGGPMPGGPQPPFNIMIPPSNGMNVTMWQPGQGGSWWLNLVPWGPGSGAGGPPAGAPPGGLPTAAPAATTAAGATTAASATTAAGESTTAAPTTAAAGK